jgi:hypothetical protein
MTNLDKLNLAVGMTKSAVARWRTAKALASFFKKNKPNTYYSDTPVSLEAANRAKNLMNFKKELGLPHAPLNPDTPIKEQAFPGLFKKMMAEGKKGETLQTGEFLNTTKPDTIFRGMSKGVYSPYREGSFVHGSPYFSVASQYASPYEGTGLSVFGRYKPLPNQRYGADWHLDARDKGMTWNQLSTLNKGKGVPIRQAYETPLTPKNKFLGYTLDFGGGTQGANLMNVPATKEWSHIFGGKKSLFAPYDPALNSAVGFGIKTKGPFIPSAQITPYLSKSRSTMNAYRQDYRNRRIDDLLNKNLLYYLAPDWARKKLFSSRLPVQTSTPTRKALPALPAKKALPALPAKKALPALPAKKALPALPAKKALPALPAKKDSILDNLIDSEPEPWSSL